MFLTHLNVFVKASIFFSKRAILNVIDFHLYVPPGSAGWGGVGGMNHSSVFWTQHLDKIDVHVFSHWLSGAEHLSAHGAHKCFLTRRQRSMFEASGCLNMESQTYSVVTVTFPTLFLWDVRFQALWKFNWLMMSSY